jgi:hypothetical protein
VSKGCFAGADSLTPDTVDEQVLEVLEEVGLRHGGGAMASAKKTTKSWRGGEKATKSRRGGESRGAEQGEDGVCEAVRRERARAWATVLKRSARAALAAASARLGRAASLCWPAPQHRRRERSPLALKGCWWTTRCGIRNTHSLHADAGAALGVTLGVASRRRGTTTAGMHVARCWTNLARKQSAR